MKTDSGHSSAPGRPIRSISPGERGSTTVSLLVVVVFLLGLGAGAFWVYRSHQTKPASAPEAGLSAGTMKVLQELQSPVEVRLYSILDPASTSEVLKQFAARVDRLLTAYEQAGGGKIKIVRHNSADSADAASADGIRAFDLDKGTPCFLGVALSSKDKKDSLPRLSPEWEGALESDLSRAIARVGTATVPANPSPVTEADKSLQQAAAEAVKKLIPNPADVSLEEGTKILREDGLAEFKAAGQKAQAAIDQAQERFLRAQTNGSPAEVSAAREALGQLRADQLEQLKEISARTMARIEALQRMKSKGQ